MATEQSTPHRNVTSRIGKKAHDLVQTTYDTVLRPRLPKRLGDFNGVTARGVGFLDATDREPEYEAGVIRSLRRHVKEGDDVVVVGGGIGVSSVVAAQQAGDSGRVVTYEASRDHVDVVEETADINDVEDRIDAYHAVVGTAVSTRGPHAGARQIKPHFLPGCDVLELDCEGAEIPILRNMEFRPPVVIVETHGFLGAPTDTVREDLVDLGYEIVNEEPEVPEKDVMVLTGVHETAENA